jgi:hypothetical protein
LGDVGIDLRHVHRAQGRERALGGDRRIEGDVKNDVVPVKLLQPQRRAAAAHEGEGEGPGRWVEAHIRDVDEGTAFGLDRPEQERGAVGAPAQMCRRQRAGAPIAVGRVEHQHFLGALADAVPQLEQMQAGLDAILHPYRHRVGPPERRKSVADELPLLGFPDGHAARRETVHRILRQVAVADVGPGVVDHDGADVGRMYRLDGQAAHLVRDELQVDVVGLGAQRRLARVDDLNGGVVGRHGAWGEEQQDRAGGAYLFDEATPDSTSPRPTFCVVIARFKRATQ